VKDAINKLKKEVYMADSGNSGQFGNRDDTQEQASKGGKASTGSFGDENSADPSEAGRKGGQSSGGNDGGQ
jgi:general stress protein YciG